MSFMQAAITGLCLAALAVGGVAQSAAAEDAVPGAPNAEALGWRIGCQLWSFNRFSFMEAIDKNASIGLKYAEAFPGQRLSADLPEDVKFDHNMSEEHRALAVKHLADRGVSLVAYGVVGIPREEEEARKIFDFAKKMGIGIVVAEPASSILDMMEKLAEEYDLKVAIHNHPKPSKYWDYKKVLEATEGRSARLGACADTGHWLRSDLNSLEAVKALEGRLVSFHLKDLGEIGNPGAEDVIWGTGIGEVEALLTEAHRQKLENPVFSIEYETNWDNNVPDIAACVAYFDQVAAKLAAK